MITKHVNTFICVTTDWTLAPLMNAQASQVVLREEEGMTHHFPEFIAAYICRLSSCRKLKVRHKKPNTCGGLSGALKRSVLV